MLKQVWINLLDNAVKFSPPEGVITVGIREEGEETLVEIQDQGPGISSEVQAHMFDKFCQGDPSHTAKGNGWGLSIVKKIVGLHGGRVSARPSEHGMTFQVAPRSARGG